MARKPKTKAAQRAKVKTVLHEWKAGTLHSGSKQGPRVTSQRQAVAIALSQSGQAGRSNVAAAKKKRKPSATASKRTPPTPKSTKGMPPGLAAYWAKKRGGK
jgi:hypothetical protein